MASNKNESNDSNSSFKVFIRVRPFNQYQNEINSSKEYMTYNQSQISVKIRNDNQFFTFDQVYHPQSTQQEIFETVADDIIDNAFMGINGTIFCYGQTSSGKTHTIVGDYSSEFSQNQGLLPRTLREVVQRRNTKIQNIKESSVDIRIKIAMVQIYNERVMDLFDLNKRDLKLRQNKKQGVFIENATQKYISNAEEAMNYVKQGLENRTVGKTNMNVYSSRSHMVFIITIHETNFHTREAKSAKITLTDLAGSEKISKTGVEGKMLIEAKKINTSLSTLGKVIQALSESKTTHIPYRDSKLTRLLQESIGGNSLTRLIINVSPSFINEYETLTSLRFGSRAKLIKNKPKVNKEYTVEELLILLEKAELKIKHQGKIIEELQKGQTSHFSRRNGGYAGLEGCQKSITMHMIGDDDEEFDDGSSYGSQSFVKSVASNQDKCSASIFGDTGVLFNQTSDFLFQAPSSKKKIRKPNICHSKSMRAIPTLDPQEDDEQIDSQREQTLPAQKKMQKSVKIADDHDSDDDGKIKNGTIYEQNESGMEQSLKNSTGMNFLLPFKSISKVFDEKSKQDNEDSDEKQQNLEVTVKINPPLNEDVKLSDITNNESSNFEVSAHTFSTTASRALSRSPKDREKQKQNQIANLREQIKQQLRDQIKEQIIEQLKQQLKEQIKDKIKQQFKEQIKNLQGKVQEMTLQLVATSTQFNGIKEKYEQTVHTLQEQKLIIKQKDHHIVEIKEKYKAKKNQINKEINKLKNFWQTGS